MKKAVGLLLVGALSTSTLHAGYQPDPTQFTDIDEMMGDPQVAEFLERVTVGGRIDQSLVDQEMRLASGEEQTWLGWILGLLAASVKASCEDGWSYRDDDKCVGKCDDWRREQKGGRENGKPRK